MRVFILGFTNAVLHTLRETREGCSVFSMLFNITGFLPNQATKLKHTASSQEGFTCSPSASIPLTLAFLPVLLTCLLFPSTHRHFDMATDGRLRSEIPVELSTCGAGRHSTQTQLKGLPLREIFGFS